MRVRAVLAAAAVAASVVTFAGAEAVTMAPAGATPVVNPTLDPMDKASVLAAYQTSLKEARSVPVGWTGSTSGCSKGTNSAASNDATLSAVNFYRALNRLDPVTFTAAGNSKALAAALMFQANNSLSHTPPTTWNCYTAEGAQGAGGSNIAQGAVAARSVDAFMSDPGGGNYFAGHRRYILSPVAQAMGTGSTTGFSALWVAEPPASRGNATEWIAWPNEGYVPKDIVAPRFSLSNNLYPNANYDSAVITVKVGATTLPVTKYGMVGGYGDNTLTWDVTLPATFNANDDDVRFDISVSGIKKADGTALPTRAYTSTATMGTSTTVAPSPPTGVTATAGNGSATVSWTAPTSPGSSPVTGYVVTPYIGSIGQTNRTFSGNTATTQTISGLTNGTAYTFRVRALSNDGVSNESAGSASVTPVAPPAAYAPFASWAAFVDRQFLDITTKAPTSAERTNWVNQLTAGAKTKGDLVDALRRGSENLANVDPVVRVYRAFLGRAPDAGGLQFWIKRKRNVAPAKTWSVTQIATEFTNSNEFKTKYGSLTNRQFVTQIYTDVLGRAADPSGVNYWTGKLDRKEKTKAQVVVGFSESSEYQRKQLENTDVAVAYIYLLGRAPTTAETTDWVTRQKAGTTHAALLTELLNSAKYSARITG